MPSIVAIIGANISQFVSGMNNAQAKAAKTGDSISTSMGKSIGKSFGSMGDMMVSKLAGVAAAAAGGFAISEAIEYGGHISDLAARLNMATDELQAWDHAMAKSGSTLEDATKYKEKLSISVQEVLGGDISKLKDFERLGITLDMLKDKAVSIPDLVKITAKTVQSGDIDYLTDALTSIGGKGALNMVVPFKEGFSDIVDDWKSSIAIMSEQTIANLDEIGDKWGETKELARGIAGTLFSGAFDFVKLVSRGLEDQVMMLIGIVEETFKAITEFDPKHPVDSFNKILAAPEKGKLDAMDLLFQQREAEKAQNRARAEEAKNSAFRLGADQEGRGQKEKDNLDKIKKQIEDEERKGLLDDMTDKSKLFYLRDELDILHEKSELQKNDIETAKVLLEIAKKKNEIGKLEDKIKKDEDSLTKAADKADAKGNRKDIMKRGANQEIGGFLGKGAINQDFQSLDLARKSETHLQGIRLSLAQIEKIVQSQGRNISLTSETEY